MYQRSLQYHYQHDNKFHFVLPMRCYAMCYNTHTVAVILCHRSQIKSRDYYLEQFLFQSAE